MYFDEPDDTAPIVTRGDNRAPCQPTVSAILLLGVFPQLFMGCALALQQSGFL